MTNSGYEFYEKILGSPKFVVAPMVDQSELAWRLLSRRHGAHLCYSPMLHADVFSRDATYRKDLQTCNEDGPLIVQFCANKPDVFLKACILAKQHCVAVDLNLGCPQSIAKRGNYGAFLEDDWDLIYNLINIVHKNLDLPITAKIRILDSVERTVEYAKMIERAGAQIITVHGRRREQKGADTGIADWSYIKAVKANVNVPVFANGNIQMPQDIQKCLQATGADAVMTAEGNLHNPYIFENVHPPVWKACTEYLNIVTQFPCPMSAARAHVFKLLHHSLSLADPSIRETLATANHIDDLHKCTMQIQALFQKEHELYEKDESSFDCGNLILPPWLCQPYFRPSKEDKSNVIARSEIDVELKSQKKIELDKLSKRSGISKSRLKKLKRQPNKLKNWLESGPPEHRECPYVICECGSPMANKCDNKACKNCCKRMCIDNKMLCNEMVIKMTSSSCIRQWFLWKLGDLAVQIYNIPPYINDKSLETSLGKFGNFMSVKFDKIAETKEKSSIFDVDTKKNSKFRTAILTFETIILRDEFFNRDWQKSPCVIFAINQPNCGYKEWREEYISKIVANPNDLLKQIEDFMDKYEEKEIQQIKTAKLKSEEMDADGWTIVTKGPKRKKHRANEAINESVSAKKKRKLKDPQELPKFYKFQQQDTKLKHLEDLQKRFEDDRKKIENMRSARKFKPE